jgi:NAD-dependent dihydropyrimidine dehydrogenase PreA subunit
MLEIVIEKERCSGCAFCVISCPQGVLDFDYDEKKAFVSDPKECIVCRNCEEQCPKQLIQVSLSI